MRMQKRNCFVHTKCNSVSLTKRKEKETSLMFTSLINTLKEN